MNELKKIFNEVDLEVIEGLGSKPGLMTVGDVSITGFYTLKEIIHGRTELSLLSVEEINKVYNDHCLLQDYFCAFEWYEPEELDSVISKLEGIIRTEMERRGTL